MVENQRKYLGIDTKVLTCLKLALAKESILLPDSDEGEIDVRRGGFSLRFSFKYDSKAQTLTLVCLKKPMLLPYNTVWAALDKGVAWCGGKVG